MNDPITMTEEHLKPPFETTVLGVVVAEESFDLPTRDDFFMVSPRGSPAGRRALEGGTAR